MTHHFEKQYSLTGNSNKNYQVKGTAAAPSFAIGNLLCKK